MAVKEALEERLSFLGLTDADRRLLAELRPLFEQHAERVVAAFYRHLLSFGETRRLLADPEVKERLLAKQRDYLLSLAGPVIDEQYIADRVRIGEVHERVGLQARWYLGAYALYFSLLAPIVGTAYRHDPERVERALSALVKLLMLDAQLAMDAYMERRQIQLDYLNRELAAAGRQLAREVEEQSLELDRTERRARAAEELAAGATLMAGLAHEIGTPMGVIRGHAEALESAVRGERAHWRLRTIREQIDRISNIIETLLNVTRPREATRVRVPLEETLETTLAFVSEKLRTRGIEVKRSFQPVPPVLGDPEKLQQLFLNLVLNAADAMPEGGTLRLELDKRDANDVEMRIADSGVGIPRDALARIFDPFYSTKPAGRGSGLGLVVARGIAHDHGGEIEVSSEAGRGTEFRIVLPIAAAQPCDSQTSPGS